MAANSDGNSEVTTIVTCKGDLLDPKFSVQFDCVIDNLNAILGKEVKVHKLEPWNSVRVTLSIPREAALHLRQLANEGSQQLRALGILSVQVEGDQVISLRLADSVNSEPQEIILNTTQDGSGNSQPNRHDESGINLISSMAIPLQSTNSDSNNAPLQFKSPNVVCPSDSVVPRVSSSSATPSNAVSGSSKPFCGPFPFTSMNQAIHGGNRDASFNSLPPPYPGKHPPVTISSPLLVNLLQNDATKDSISNLKGNQQPLRTIRTPPATQQKVSVATVSSMVTTVSSFVKPNNSISTQADIASNSVSLSALSTNTSIRKQSSTLMTSTSNRVGIKSPPLLPPQYHRGIVTTMVTKQAVANSNVKIHTSLLESQTQSTLGISQHLQSSSSNMMQSNIPQSSHQTQAVSTTQAQHFPSTVHAPVTGSSMISKSSQKLSPLPQVKPSLLSPNIPLGKSSVMSVVPPKSIFNITTINTNSLPTTVRSPSPQVDSLQNQDGSFMNQKVKITENNLMQTVASSAVSPQVLVTQGTTSSNIAVLNNVDTINSGNANANNILLRSLPSPPPYSVAISRTWDTSVNSNSLLDLTPSLTDLKPDELEELLPSLELTESPLPDLPDDFLNVNPSLITSAEEIKVSNMEKRKFLINPLTGELEPQSSDESDHEELQDVFTGLRSPPSLSDEDTCSTSRMDPVTDQSDNEARSVDKIPKLKNTRDRGRDSPSLKQEKIKLRLKLEKSEPINAAYKVDVSYINSQPKKASVVSTTGEELRVPPLHISLRGRNSVVIKNKSKVHPDLLLQNSKVKKNQDHSRIKKSDSAISIPRTDEFFEGLGTSSIPEATAALEQMKMKMHNVEQKKTKKMKTGHENMEIIASLSQEGELKSKFFIHNHFKEKQKERRGSDSDLIRNNKKFPDSGGVLFDEKKRRLSQTDHDQPSIVGSTNVGTIAGLPQKPRKDKFKMRDLFKKDTSKSKSFCKIAGDKLHNKVVSLPIAGDMNMEAKFKQGLLEGNNEKNVRTPHRTELNNVLAETSTTDNKLATTVPDTTQNLKENALDTEKSTTEIKSSIELVEKSTTVPGNRSPNTGGGQGEDSGIESMDALSEKSPNQASQSPHADIIIPKTQVPNILDIEAQLAKMEGLDRDTYQVDEHEHSTNIPTEDVNENKCHRDPAVKLNQCCELTCVLQDTLSQENESLSPPLESPIKEPDINLLPLKTKKEEEDLDPVPVRITPALYTYSNPEKGRVGLESPAGLSDDDSNSCSTSGVIHNKPSKSLLEQLLIEIPNDHQSVPSSPSPATRLSVRTRALSKLESPELISLVPKNNQNNRTVPPTKRKRNESDSSNHSVEENVKKLKKKTNVHINDCAKTKHPTDPSKASIKKVLKEQDESSDSDEPLIEKMKKSSTAVNTQVSNLVAAKTKVKVGPGNVANNNNKGWMVNTRRSVRGNLSTQNNTRTKGEKIQSESEALRRKTRSTVVDVEKRKKEVK